MIFMQSFIMQNSLWHLLQILIIPQNYSNLEGADAQAMLKLYEAIDDNDDVQKVYANFDIDESEMEQILRDKGRGTREER